MTERRLAARDEEIRGLREALALARRRCAEATSLYVATHRLHSTLDRAHVLAALEEILGSLLGCEEFAVFEYAGQPRTLTPVATTGLPPGWVAPLRSPAGVLAQALDGGRVWTAQGATEEMFGLPVTACIPLVVDGEATGVIVLFRLLSHKTGLEPADLELLDVVSQHAGIALFVTRAGRRSLRTAR